MAIESFTKEGFESALPKGDWSYVGVIEGEHTYLITPSDESKYGIMLRSSVHGNQSAGLGEDSIRAWICNSRDLTPYGGKSQRWVDRRKGWQDRMNRMIQKLSDQICWLVPCPHCKQDLVPFTSKKGKKENKDRGFVTCKNARCPTPSPSGRKKKRRTIAQLARSVAVEQNGWEVERDSVAFAQGAGTLWRSRASGTGNAMAWCGISPYKRCQRLCLPSRRANVRSPLLSAS